MADIQRLIKMLQSENAHQRYVACEELRVSPSLTPEAIEALRSATSDANPDVADAAQRAIRLHTSDDSNSTIFDKNALQDGASNSGGTPWLSCSAVLVFITLGLTFFAMSLLSEFGSGQGGIIFVPIFLVWLIVAISAVVTGFRSTRSQVKYTSAYLYLMITLMVGSMVILLAVGEGIPPLFDTLLCASPGLVGIVLAAVRIQSHRRLSKLPESS